METHGPERTLQELDPALALPHRRKMEILFAVLLVVFLAALDQTIVGVALPRIVFELGGTNELYTWVITSYLLTATITGVFYGKLSDIYGRRRMMLIALGIFTAGSVLCALAPNMIVVILGRAVQGIGGGALLPLAQTVIADVITPRERGQYQAYIGIAWVGADEVLFTAWKSGIGQQVYSVDTVFGGAPQLASDELELEYLAGAPLDDRVAMAFNSYADQEVSGNLVLWSEGKEMHIETGSRLLRYPAWSPLGDQVAVAGQRKDYTWGLTVIDVGSGAVTELPTPGEIRAVSW